MRGAANRRAGRFGLGVWAPVLVTVVALILLVAVLPAATPTPAPESTPAPTSTPTPSSSVRVSSIPALLTALANDAVDEVVVANGTYRVSPSSRLATDSLWIGARFAGRTRPVTVRAETRGGVTFDGGGGSAFGGLSFEDGAHHQTWDGFHFANMAARETGIIEVGGYLPRRTPHHITLRNIVIEASCTGRATTGTAVPGTTASTSLTPSARDPTTS